ncbi:neurofilament medium polypeptide-like isoform X1 [Procambarus clarkii]|uniref:neurofilament medium polypeptide-like isoform X1 n=1 Tax=Procambarus clarkii TaxID=6728 RepID=UPI0037426289
MGAGSSTSQLRRNVSDEIRSCARSWKTSRSMTLIVASLGGMKTVYKMFHSALNEIEKKCTLKDEGQELVSCTEKKSTDESTVKDEGQELVSSAEKKSTAESTLRYEGQELVSYTEKSTDESTLMDEGQELVSCTEKNTNESTLKDEGQELVSCTEKKSTDESTLRYEGQELVACTEKSTEEIVETTTDKSTVKSVATEQKKKIEKQKKEEKTEPTLDSVIDELDKLWEEEISPMDDAAAVFLLKLLCAVRLTLEKALHKIAKVEEFDENQGRNDHERMF